MHLFTSNMTITIVGLLIGFGIIVIIGFLCYAVILRRRLSDQEKLLIKNIHNLIQEIQSIQARLKAYEPYTKEPLLTGMMDISSEVDQIILKKEKLVNGYVKFRQETRKILRSSNFSLKFHWNLFQINHLLNNSRFLIGEIAPLLEKLTELNERFNDVKEYPWSLALQARELIEYFQQAKKNLQDLNALGLHGEDLEQRLEQIENTQNEISLIPVYFLMDVREQLLKEVSLEDLTKVQQIVQGELPNVMQIIRDTEKWKNQILSIKLETSIAKKQLERSKNELKFIPEEIDLEYMRDNIDKWLEEINSLSNNISQANIAELNSFSLRISDILSHLQRDQKELSRLRRMLTNYQNLMRFTNSEKENLEAIFKQVEDKDKKLEINWNISSPIYTQCINELNHIHAISPPYSPALLAELIDQAQDLYDHLYNLRERTHEINQAFQELILQFESFETADWFSYLEKTKKYEQLFGGYNPKNFIQRDWVIGYSEKRAQIEQAFQNVHAKLKEKIIQEADVIETNELLKNFLTKALPFRTQTEQLLDELQTIQKTEKECAELLRNSR
ncbi:MAG: hypothetical protein ACPL0B_01140, partial [Anaerolineales bacterium]